MAAAAKEKNSGPLRGRLYEELRTDILTHRLRDGTRLSEAFICRKYDVSRTPAREALFQLGAEGLVMFIPNRGAFVTGLSDRDISDIFDMRCLFEMQAAEWAIRRMVSEDTDRLYETLNMMELYTLRGDSERILGFDEQFHDIIYEGSGDRMIRNSLLTYRAYIKGSLPPNAYPQDQLGTIFDEHKAIYAAFEAKDPEAGRRAVEVHLKNAKSRCMQALFNDHK